MVQRASQSGDCVAEHGVGELFGGRYVLLDSAVTAPSFINEVLSFSLQKLAVVVVFVPM